MKHALLCVAATTLAACPRAERCSRDFQLVDFDPKGNQPLQMEIVSLDVEGNELHARVGFDPELVDVCAFVDPPCANDGRVSWTLPFVPGARTGRELAGARGPGAASINDPGGVVILQDENRDVVFWAGEGQFADVESSHQRDESFCEAGAFDGGYFTSVVAHGEDGDVFVPAGGEATVRLRGQDFALNVPWSFEGGGVTETIFNLWPL